jgi:hypothetical protein
VEVKRRASIVTIRIISSIEQGPPLPPRLTTVRLRHALIGIDTIAQTWKAIQTYSAFTIKKNKVAPVTTKAKRA